MHEELNKSVKTAIELAKAQGFECHGLTSAAELEVNPEVRAMCAADRCRSYGCNWMCPPACGDLSSFEEKIASHESCIVVQTVAELEDEFDFEGMMDAEKEHKRRFYALAKSIRDNAELGSSPLLLAAGTCALCPQCSYPDEPCRHPETALVSMEAAGLLVSDVCVKAGIPYNHGKGTIAYTGCLLI